MLQTRNASVADPPRAAPVARETRTEFPPPATDLAKASIRTPACAPPLEETVPSAILEEIDRISKETTGENVISSLLDSLGTSRRKAVDDFAGRNTSSSRSLLGTIHAITGITGDQILHWCPSLDYSAANMRIKDPEKACSLTREIIRGLAAGMPLRDLAIESVTKITLPPSHEHVAHKEEVAEKYEDLLKRVSTPGVSDIAFYLLSYAGRIGKAILSPLSGAVRAVPGALKRSGMFLLNVAVIENLPSALKDKLKLGSDDREDLTHTYVLSIIAAGAATGGFAGSLLTNIYHGNRMENMLAGLLIGSMAEPFARAMIDGVRKTRYRSLPGWAALELIFLPYHLLAYAGNGLKALRSKLQQQRMEKFRQHGM